MFNFLDKWFIKIFATFGCDFTATDTSIIKFIPFQMFVLKYQHGSRISRFPK